MIKTLSFSLETPLQRRPNPGGVGRLRIEARDATGTLLINDSYLCEVSRTGVIDAVLAADMVLAGESLDLLSFTYDDCKLKLANHADGLGIRVEGTTPDTDVDVVGPHRVAPDTVVEALLTFAQEHRAQRDRAEIANTYTDTRLAVGINHAERSLAYYREYGSMAGFEPTIDPEHLETFALECRSDDRLQEFVLRTSDLEEFVLGLRELEDDREADRYYGKLLGYDDEICERTARVLVDNPDPRARRGLFGQLWSNTTKKALIVEALAEIPDTDVVIDLGRFVGRHSDDAPYVVLTAIEALESIAVEEHLDADDWERFESALRDGLAEATDPEVRRAIEELLADVS